MILFSFNSIKSLTNFEGFSLQWYEEFLNDPTLRESLFVSLEIAFLTMLVATASGPRWRSASCARGRAGRRGRTS